jgi:NADH-quinone oxidoreductase subunit L
MHFVIHHSYLIPLLPLLGAIISGFFGKKFLKGQSHWPIWIGVGLAALMSLTLLFGMIAAVHGTDGPTGFVQNYYTWVQAGPFTAKAGYFFDPLTAVMLSVVTGIGFFITVFAAGYMKGEEGYYRFFAYLGLFIFAMTNLVMGENLVMLYLGWEGVGLCSYLLIGYYFERPAAREAAKKAFLVNRVGDFGFALGIMLSFWAFATISYYGKGVGSGTGLIEMARAAMMHPAGAMVTPLVARQIWALKYIPFLLMLGAFGKSAQFPLYVWLPDAMEGPTPVSALIHAATMVTAGVYMIVRCGTLFFGNHAAMMTIAAVGAFTAILAASIALRQFDLKKVFAYSTISQLGYMFVGVGVLAPTAAVFHLVTHAFFKALLFLSSGVVMHAMLGHLDMRKMSGLKAVLPRTNILMLIGCLALAGCPFFSGYFSKDEIVGQSLNHSAIIYAVVLFTAFMTAYYTFRLYFQVFQGPLMVPSEPAEGHAHTDEHHSDDAHAAGISSHSGGHQDHAEAAASHEAVATDTVSTSGVDKAPAHGTSGHAPGMGHDDAHGHGDHGAHNHEPAIMIYPLIVLAIGAVLAGYLNWPKAALSGFLGHSPSIAYAYDVAAYHYGANNELVKPALFGVSEAAMPGREEPFISMAMLIGGAVSIAGILLAYSLHLRDRQRAQRLAAGLQPLTGALEAKWWVDEIYQNTIVEPLRQVGVMFFAIDRIVVDGLVWLVSFIPQMSGLALKLGLQRGYLQGYAAAMGFGIVAILLILFF